MAKTDTQAEALAKNIDTETPVALDTFTIRDAAHTQMHFFTEQVDGEDVITVECLMLVEGDGAGDDDVVPDMTARKVQKFPISDALPEDLQAAAQLIQLYIHNHAVERANS